MAMGGLFGQPGIQHPARLLPFIAQAVKHVVPRSPTDSADSITAALFSSSWSKSRTSIATMSLAAVALSCSATSVRSSTSRSVATGLPAHHFVDPNRGEGRGAPLRDRVVAINPQLLSDG